MRARCSVSLDFTAIYSSLWGICRCPSTVTGYPTFRKRPVYGSTREEKAERSCAWSKYKLTATIQFGNSVASMSVLASRTHTWDELWIISRVKHADRALLDLYPSDEQLVISFGSATRSTEATKKNPRSRYHAFSRGVIRWTVTRNFCIIGMRALALENLPQRVCASNHACIS